MSNVKTEKNRFGVDVTTAIPADAPLAKQPGHKLRTSNTIVDRKAVSEREKLLEVQRDKVHTHKVHFVSAGNQIAVSSCSDNENEEKIPNRFTGPNFRTPREKFRFDGHKMLHHMDRVEAWQRGERIAPIHIDMGLTKFCNTACLYCYAVVQNMSQGEMIQPDALLRYIEDCGRLGVRSIGFIGDGEPTLNPAVYDATVLASTHGVDTAMATNGLLLDMDRAHDLLRNMAWIRVNLSAGTPEGFQRVHQSKARNFDLLVEKIRELVRIKKEHGYKCSLGLQMVLIPECYDQVLAEAQLGAELGVDYFVIKQCSDSEYKEIGIDYADFLNIESVLTQAEAMSNSNYVVQAKWNKIRAAGESPLYKDGFRKYDQCFGTPFLLQISGNGKIYPCGPFFNKERFFIGDIHTESFHDIVLGDRYWSVHRDISSAVDVHKDCAIGCRQDYVNKFLWDLINPPEHLNFI